MSNSLQLFESRPQQWKHWVLITGLPGIFSIYPFKLEFSLDICLGMGLLDHITALLLVFFVFFFKELPSYSPWWLHQFHIPTNKGSPSSPLLQILSSIYYLQTFWGDEPHGLQDLSSPTRDCMLATTVKALSPNHWTTKVFPDSKI